MPDKQTKYILEYKDDATIPKGNPEEIAEWLEAEQAYRDGFAKGLYHIKSRYGELGKFDIEDAQVARTICQHNAEAPGIRTAEEPNPVVLKYKRQHRAAAASTRGFHQALVQYEQDKIEYHKANQDGWRDILNRWYKRVSQWLGTDICTDAVLRPPRPLDEDCQTEEKENQLEKRPGAVVIRASDIKPELIRWLWYGFLAEGKLTLLASDPGCGKSTVTVDIASRLSIASQCPVSGDLIEEPCGTVFLSAEDGASDTLIPRMMVAGANRDNIFMLEAVREPELDSKGNVHKTKERSINLENDLPHLETAIRQTPNCKLVVIDPVSAYLGKADSHKNADIRSMLAPLQALAEKHRVAVLLISHLNKSDSKAAYRVTGSIAFSAACRISLLAVKDPDDYGRRVIVPIKVNIARDDMGLAYRIEMVQRKDLPPEEARLEKNLVSRVNWESGIVTESADDILKRESKQRTSDNHSDEFYPVVDCIRSFLDGDEGKQFGEIKNHVNEAFGSIGDKKLRQAIHKAGGVSERQGYQGKTIWRLPDTSKLIESLMEQSP